MVRLVKKKVDSNNCRTFYVCFPKRTISIFISHKSRVQQAVTTADEFSFIRRGLLNCDRLEKKIGATSDVRTFTMDHFQAKALSYFFVI